MADMAEIIAKWFPLPPPPWELANALTPGGTLTLGYDQSRRIFTWTYRNSGRFVVYLYRVDILKEESPGTFKSVKIWGTAAPRVWRSVYGGKSVSASYQVPTADIGKKFYAHAEFSSWSSENSSRLVATYRPAS